MRQQRRDQRFLLILTADYVPGNWSGIGVAVAAQANGLARLGYRVEVATSREMSCSRSPRGQAPFVHSLNGTGFPVQVHQSEVVHLHSLSLFELAMQLQSRFGTRILYTAHSLLSQESTAIPDRWVREQERALESADHVFFVSHADRQIAVRSDTALGKKSSVLYNGIDPVPHNPNRDPDGSVLYAGRFTHSKGIDIAVATVRGLIERGHCGSFVFAGGHGDPHETRQIRSLVDQFPKQCRMTGWLDRHNLLQEIAKAALLIAPSRYEPFGMVAIEAMSMGVPVLGSGAGGQQEILTHESGGRIVEGGGPANWIAACQRLLYDQSDWNALSCRGPEFVRSRFDSRTLGLQLAATVDRVRFGSTVLQDEFQPVPEP